MVVDELSLESFFVFRVSFLSSFKIFFGGGSGGFDDDNLYDFSLGRWYLFFIMDYDVLFWYDL